MSVKLTIYYWKKGINSVEINSDEWKTKAPQDILAIRYTNKNGAISEIKGWGAYFACNNKIGGFNAINAINLETDSTEPTRVEDVIRKSKNSIIRFGAEISNQEWVNFNKQI